jgi:hypothetical protein
MSGSYYQQNKEKIKARNKAYYWSNRDYVLERQKKYQANNAESYRARARKWEKNNPDRVKANKKRLRQGDNYKIWRKKYRDFRFATDINFKILERYRKRLWDALKGNNKSASTLNLLGCTVEFFKNYIEAKFVSGMSWDNYGEWHIDHIKPCASFDLSVDSEQIACFHYTNLQPLWAKDNISKGARLT